MRLNELLVSNVKKLKNFTGPKVWRLFCASIITGFCWFLLESSFVLILQGFLYSLGLLKESQVFLPSWYPKDINSSILILIAFGVLRSVVSVLKSYFASMTQVSFMCVQRASILEFSLRNAGEVSSKEVISSFTELTTQSGVVLFYSSLLINTTVTSIFLFLFGLRLAFFEMLIAVFLLLLLLLPMRMLSGRIGAHGKGLVKEWESLSETLLRGLRNNFFLKVHNKIESEITKGKMNLSLYENHYDKYSMISGFVSAFPLFIGVIVLSFTTFVSVNYIHTDGIKLISFFYIFIRLAQAASEVSNTFSFLRLNIQGFKTLFQWRFRKSEDYLPEKDREEVLLGGVDSVEFNGVSFYYKNHIPLFKDISFKLRKGDILIIKGQSGAGKSTLLSVAMCLKLPVTGSVFINGFDSKKTKINFYDFLGYVGPEPYLIQGSIKENLMYGNRCTDLDDSVIWDILKRLEISSLVDSLPLKLNENLLELASLSTGQKQRISIARAILRFPQMLILDEATANLDSLTESSIIDNLHTLVPNSIIIIVTHKNSFDNLGTQHIELKNFFSEKGLV